MPDTAEQVSHLEIFRAVVALETKVDLLLKREDARSEQDEGRDDRINKLDNKLSLWTGVALAASFIIPLVVTAVSPRLHFGPEHAAEARPR
jgi:hypothetical protein